MDTSTLKTLESICVGIQQRGLCMEYVAAQNIECTQKIKAKNIYVFTAAQIDEFDFDEHFKNNYDIHLQSDRYFITNYTIAERLKQYNVVCTETNVGVLVSKRPFYVYRTVTYGGNVKDGVMTLTIHQTLDISRVDSDSLMSFVDGSGYKFKFKLPYVHALKYGIILSDDVGVGKESSYYGSGFHVNSSDPIFVDILKDHGFSVTTSNPRAPIYYVYVKDTVSSAEFRALSDALYMCRLGGAHVGMKIIFGSKSSDRRALLDKLRAFNKR